jgi:hypothetical protein
MPARRDHNLFMKFFRDALFALLISAGFFLLLEGGLRLAHAHYQASFYQTEQERRFSLRPNAVGWNVSENEVYIRINGDGMRDHERPVSRPPSTLRVALLGSSEAEGRQVPLEKTFASVLERHLNQALSQQGSQVDVMNFAVNGYTFSQNYLTLHNHVWKYDPQIVILVISVPNVFKNTRELNWGDPNIPFYVLRNGQLVPDETTRAASPLNRWRLYWKNRFSDLMNRSTLLTLFNEATNKAIDGLQKEQHVLSTKLRRTPTATASPTLPAGYPYMPDLPNTQEAWAIGEGFLELMRQECSARGAEFWIVSADQDMQSHPSLEERARYASKLHVDSLEASDRRVQRFGEAHGIPVVLLAPFMGDYAAAHDVALHGFPATPFDSDPWPYATGHWNELGDELAGSFVARQVLQRSSVVRRRESLATTTGVPQVHGLEGNP